MSENIYEFSLVHLGDRYFIHVHCEEYFSKHGLFEGPWDHIRHDSNDDDVKIRMKDGKLYCFSDGNGDRFREFLRLHTVSPENTTVTITLSS